MSIRCHLSARFRPHNRTTAELHQRSRLFVVPSALVWKYSRSFWYADNFPLQPHIVLDCADPLANIGKKRKIAVEVGCDVNVILPVTGFLGVRRN